MNDEVSLKDVREDLKKNELLFFWQVVSNGIRRVDGVVFLSECRCETSDGVSGPGEWIRSQSRYSHTATNVASFPAYFKIILLPPVSKIRR
jgi:hypothetical protein